MLAAINGHEAAMKVLLQAGADLTVQNQVRE
jgi:ankyrin repeat protein